jgi:hypothetical protein
MNNLFHAFSISVSSDVLDDKMFYEYADYDNTSTTVPTDAETIAKAKAFIRLKHLKRKLSELTVPVFLTITFGTEGTASTIPESADIVVGYTTIEPFLSQEDPGSILTDDQRKLAAAEVLREIINNALSEVIEDEFLAVQKTYERVQFPGSTNTETYRELETVYLTVEAAGVTAVVAYITLAAL